MEQSGTLSIFDSRKEERLNAATGDQISARKYNAVMLLTLMWGCSSDNGDGGNNSNGGDGENAITFTEVSERPDWKVDWMWHSEMPDWQNPNATLYEERMYVTLKLDDEFVPYSTSNDRMAIFIGSECRGVSERNVSEYDSNSILFPIMVLGNRRDAENLASLTVTYYSGGMKQIFNNPSLSRFSVPLVVSVVPVLAIRPSIKGFITLTWNSCLELMPSSTCLNSEYL